MPLDIFADYISEQLNVEYNWVYLLSLHFYKMPYGPIKFTEGYYHEKSGSGHELYISLDDFYEATGDGGGFSSLGCAYFYSGFEGKGQSPDHEHQSW